MGTFEIVFGVVLLALAAFQVWLSVAVARSDMYDKSQKTRQIQFVWLLPILGAGLVFFMLRGDEAARRGPSEISRQA